MLWTLSQTQNTRTNKRYTRCRLVSLLFVVGWRTFGVNFGNPSETRGFPNSDCMSWHRSGFLNTVWWRQPSFSTVKSGDVSQTSLRYVLMYWTVYWHVAAPANVTTLPSSSDHAQSHTIIWLLNYSNCFLKGWFPKMTRNHILSINYWLLPPLYVTLSEKYTIKKIQHFKRLVW